MTKPQFIEYLKDLEHRNPLMFPMSHVRIAELVLEHVDRTIETGNSERRSLVEVAHDLLTSCDELDIQLQR